MVWQGGFATPLYESLHASPRPFISSPDVVVPQADLRSNPNILFIAQATLQSGFNIVSTRGDGTRVEAILR